jgi:hypothetical protein
MISDVLFEALEEIERYQTDFDHYRNAAHLIEPVKSAMLALQRYYDNPFPTVHEESLTGFALLVDNYEFLLQFQQKRLEVLEAENAALRQKVLAREEVPEVRTSA